MADRFLYFAYGSNMLTRRLRAPDRAPSARAEGTGFVAGYRLTFDKASADRSGKCDLEATGHPNDRVHGVLFSINRAEERALDKAEGRDKGYRKDTLDVVTTDGMRTAVVYIATAKDSACRPFHWYKALVVAGAVEHGLPQSYVERIRTTESQPDPDNVRRTKNEALLFNN
jgi:gamma-glutamylcyclotransferase